MKRKSNKIIDITELSNEHQENIIAITNYIDERLRKPKQKNKKKPKKVKKNLYHHYMINLILFNQIIMYSIIFYLLANS